MARKQQEPAERHLDPETRKQSLQFEELLGVEPRTGRTLRGGVCMAADKCGR
jgi:hypothetical protein